VVVPLSCKLLRHVPLLSSSILLTGQGDSTSSDAMVEKVTTGLAESNSSLTLALMTKSSAC